MLEPVAPTLLFALVSDFYNLIESAKHAPAQIQGLAGSLEQCYYVLASLKAGLDAAKEADKQAVDTPALRHALERLHRACQELTKLLGRFTDAKGATRKGWRVKVRFLLQKRRLGVLEEEFARADRDLNRALHASQWIKNINQPDRSSTSTSSLNHTNPQRLVTPSHPKSEPTPAPSSLSSRNLQPDHKQSVGCLRESIKRSGWNVDKAERRALEDRLSQPSSASLPLLSSPPLASARSLSTLSLRTRPSDSVLDLVQNVPQEDILQIVKQRLKNQDREVEIEHTRSLSDSRFEAYRRLKQAAEYPTRAVGRSVSAPLLASSPPEHDHENRAAAIISDSDPRRSSSSSSSVRRSVQRLSSSGSYLGSIYEDAPPPPVPIKTKPSLETVASRKRHSNSSILSNGSLSTRATSWNSLRSTQSTTPMALVDSARSHNSMGNVVSSTRSSKASTRGTRGLTAHRRDEQENQRPFV